MYRTDRVPAGNANGNAVFAVAIGSVTLVRRNRTFGLIAVAVAVTVFLNQAAHPMVSQSDRLLMEVSVAAVLGLPLLANPRSNTPVEEPPDSPALLAGEVADGTILTARTPPDQVRQAAGS